MIAFVTKMRTWIERKYAENNIYLTFEHNINVRFTQLFCSFTDKTLSLLFSEADPFVNNIRLLTAFLFWKRSKCWRMKMLKRQEKS